MYPVEYFLLYYLLWHILQRKSVKAALLSVPCTLNIAMAGEMFYETQKGYIYFIYHFFDCFKSQYMLICHEYGFFNKRTWRKKATRRNSWKKGPVKSKENNQNHTALVKKVIGRSLINNEKIMDVKQLEWIYLRKIKTRNSTEIW